MDVPLLDRPDGSHRHHRQAPHPVIQGAWASARHSLRATRYSGLAAFAAPTFSRARAPLAAVALLLGVPAAFAAGEFSITTPDPQFQNFDSLGTNASATLPTGWLMSGAGGGNTTTWASANNTGNVTQEASSGSPTTGGRYNWGSDEIERALGFMTSGSYANPNSILYGIINDTGGLVTSIDLAFDYERYRINTSAASVAFSYSVDGTTWIADALGDSGSFSTGNSSYTFSGGTVVSRSFTISGLTLSNADTFYFRWNFNTTGTNSQGIGLDNVSLTLNPAPNPWTGTGSGGTWANGAVGSFGGAYANDLANTVTFTGTAETVTATGPPQAGSLLFSTPGYTLAGAVQLGIGTITAPTGTTTISANISGNGSSGLTKNGAGTLILSGFNNYTGPTDITAGVLEAAYPNALGTSDAGTTVSDGATLALSNGIDLSSEPLTLSGNGFGSNGALRNLSGYSFTGAIALQSNTRIQNDSGTLQIQGGITGAGRALTVAGGGSTRIQDAGLNTGSGGSLVKVDSGTLMVLAGGNFTGGTSITGGTIEVSHASALGTGAVTITSGSLMAYSGTTLGNDIVIGNPGTGGSVIYTQNFNGIGSGLPTGWTVATGANATALGTTQSFNATAIAWNQTTGAFKNYASATGLTSSSDAATQAASADRALGVRQGGSFGGDPGAAFNYAFSTTGQTIGFLSLDMMMLDVQARSTTWSLQYGIGASPASFTTLGTWSDPAAWGTTPLTFTTADFGTNLDNQANLVFRVVALSASTGSGSRDSIAIDNFSLFSSAGAGTGSGTIGVVNTPGMAVYSGNLTIHGAATLSAGVGNATFSGNFSGAGNVTKSGTGTVILTGNAAHTGGTTVSDGTLRVNGTHGSAIAVSWATLGGNGTISGLTTLNSGATLAPGNSVGTLTFTSGLSLNSTSTVVMEINGTTAGQFDTVNVSGGSLTYAGSLQLVFGHTPAVNDSYQLFTGSAVAGAAGNFGTITFTGQPEYAGTFAPGTGTLTITAIPEPQTFALLGMAGCFLLWHLRRRKAASPPLLPEN